MTCQVIYAVGVSARQERALSEGIGRSWKRTCTNKRQRFGKRLYLWDFLMMRAIKIGKRESNSDSARQVQTERRGGRQMMTDSGTSDLLVANVNRKRWWHVPPRDSEAYRKRGKFLASTFEEAEFWGRPLDEPQKATIARPLVGDEAAIEEELFGRRISRDDIGLEGRWKLDAKMRRAALARGYDSIVLMTPAAFARFTSSGKVPRSLELNILKTNDPDFFTGDR
jgi:hypothetical protein